MILDEGEGDKNDNIREGCKSINFELFFNYYYYQQLLSIQIYFMIQKKTISINRKYAFYLSFKINYSFF